MYHVIEIQDESSEKSSIAFNLLEVGFNSILLTVRYGKFKGVDLMLGGLLCGDGTRCGYVLGLGRKEERKGKRKEGGRCGWIRDLGLGSRGWGLIHICIGL